MGNVGSITAKLLYREGMKIIAVSDVSGGICNPEGLNIPAILDYLSLNRKNLLKDYNEEGMSRITNEELLEMDAGYWCRQPLKIRLTLPMHIKSVRKSLWRQQTARLRRRGRHTPGQRHYRWFPIFCQCRRRGGFLF